MSLLYAILIIGYLAVALRHSDFVVYSLLGIHTVTAATLLVDVKVSDPKLGLTMVAWCMTTAAIYASKHNKWSSLVTPMMNSVTILLTLGWLAPVPSNSPLEVQTWVGMHIGLVLMGYTGCIAAGVLSGVYLFVQSKLKEKSLVTVVKYPSLGVLENYFTTGIWIGVLGLFTGVTSGILWGVHKNSLNWDFTTVSSILLLLWYTTASFGRFGGRSARWTAWMSVLGILGLFVYFLLSAIIGSWHVGGI